MSPQKNNIWGDYARTLVIENGVVCEEIDGIKKDDWRNGLQMEAHLHKTLVDVPDMTFEELYYYMNDLIVTDVKMFTFEPHISIPDSKYGYKREDIYYFDNGINKDGENYEYYIYRC